jgi:hypothetical protein
MFGLTSVTEATIPHAIVKACTELPTQENVHNQASEDMFTRG